MSIATTTAAMSAARAVHRVGYSSQPETPITGADVAVIFASAFIVYLFALFITRHKPHR